MCQMDRHEIHLFNYSPRKLKGCRIRDRTEIIGHVEYNDPITRTRSKIRKTTAYQEIQGLSVFSLVRIRLQNHLLIFSIMMKKNCVLILLLHYGMKQNSFRNMLI